MISNPHVELREHLGKPHGWRPDWADRLEVRRYGNRTVYHAHPEQIEVPSMQELCQIADLGWTVTLDSPRLNRMRVSIWKGDHQ